MPGNIIFKQRGTLWFPGENCGMGRDHTIYALAKGYVRYYRDPEKHKEHKFIGIVHTQEERLPRGRNMARRRKLGMVSVPIREKEPEPRELLVQDVFKHENPSGLLSQAQIKRGVAPPDTRLRPGYQYRESNWSIGRSDIRADSHVTKAYDKKDRAILNERKRQAEKERSSRKKALEKNRRVKQHARRLAVKAK